MTTTSKRVIRKFSLMMGLAAALLLIAPRMAYTAQSGTGDACKVKYVFTAPSLDQFQDETTSMIESIHAKFAKISEDAARLQVYSKYPETPSRMTHSTKLAALKQAANDVAADVCKLRSRKYLAASWQRDITEELAMSINTMNLHVATAIEHLNTAGTTEALFFTDYDESIDAIFEISSRMERRTEQFLNYGEWKESRPASTE